MLGTARAAGGLEGQGREAVEDEAALTLPLDQARVLLELDPGDVAVFRGLTPHQSAPNRSSQPRRAFYVSYNALSDGGDQRAGHYAQFQERMRARLAPTSAQPLYFR